jgi:hypothetical protein
VEKDEREAVRWYTEAVSRGNLRAALSLAQAYDQGKGVARDAVEACAFATVAESAISSSDDDGRQQAAKLKARLSEELSPEREEQAARRTREILKARVERGLGRMSWRMNPCRCGHPYEPGFSCKRGRNLPDGQITESCPAPFAKKFRFAADPNQQYIAHRPVPQRGVRTSRTRDGMRWTRQRGLTNGADADGEVVWS